MKSLAVGAMLASVRPELVGMLVISSPPKMREVVGIVNTPEAFLYPGWSAVPATMARPAS
jgi:hypothetical protein